MDEQTNNATAEQSNPPVKAEEGTTVHPTSFLPPKSLMEPSRIPLAKMSGLEIEAIHVVIFFLLIFVLFAQVWKKPNQR